LFFFAQWECPDFYQIPLTDAWVLKASANSQDWWTVGKFVETVGDDSAPDTFVLANASHDILQNDQLYGE
jgi:hypothetical protein